VIYCSFCGRSNDEVSVVIAGEGAAICDECIDIATEIVIEQRRKASAAIRDRRNAEAYERKAWEGTGP
jgi:ATP-dependent protease Clp ATPase subunit